MEREALRPLSQDAANKESLSREEQLRRWQERKRKGKKGSDAAGAAGKQQQQCNPKKDKAPKRRADDVEGGGDQPARKSPKTSPEAVASQEGVRVHEPAVVQNAPESRCLHAVFQKEEENEGSQKIAAEEVMHDHLAESKEAQECPPEEQARTTPAPVVEEQKESQQQEPIFRISESALPLPSFEFAEYNRAWRELQEVRRQLRQGQTPESAVRAVERAESAYVHLHVVHETQSLEVGFLQEEMREAQHRIRQLEGKVLLWKRRFQKSAGERPPSRDAATVTMVHGDRMQRLLQEHGERSALQFANEMMMQERVQAERRHQEREDSLRKEVQDWETMSQKTVANMKETLQNAMGSSLQKLREKEETIQELRRQLEEATKKG